MGTSVSQPNSSHKLPAAVPTNSLGGWVIAFTQRRAWDYISVRLQPLLLCTPKGAEGCFLIFLFGYRLCERDRQWSFLSAHEMLCSVVKQDMFPASDAGLHKAGKGLAKLP